MEDKTKVDEILEEEHKDLNPDDVDDPANEDPNPDDDDPNDGGNPEGDDKPEKKKQSRQQNAKYAELRRKNAELEQKNKELKAEAVKASFNAKKDVISKDTLASIGLDAIETEEDLILANAYEEALASGSEDPLKDAIKVQRDHSRKEAVKKHAAEEEKNAQREKVVQDQAAFKKKFGIETSEVYGKDEKFMALFGDLIQPGNLTELYTRYKAAFPDEGGSADDEVAKQKGLIPTPSNKAQKKTKKELHELEGDEFLAEYEKRFNS